MAFKKLTTEERLEAGHDLRIYGALQCAGGFSHVARVLGIALATPRAWVRYGNIPVKYREQVCQMGGGVFKPSQLAKRKAKKQSESQEA